MKCYYRKHLYKYENVALKQVCEEYQRYDYAESDCDSNSKIVQQSKHQSLAIIAIVGQEDYGHQQRLKLKANEFHTHFTFHLLTEIKSLRSPRGDFAEEQFISDVQDTVNDLTDLFRAHNEKLYHYLLYTPH